MGTSKRIPDSLLAVPALPFRSHKGLANAVAYAYSYASANCVSKGVLRATQRGLYSDMSKAILQQSKPGFYHLFVIVSE